MASSSRLSNLTLRPKEGHEDPTSYGVIHGSGDNALSIASDEANVYRATGDRDWIYVSKEKNLTLGSESDHMRDNRSKENDLMDGSGEGGLPNESEVAQGRTARSVGKRRAIFSSCPWVTSTSESTPFQQDESIDHERLPDLSPLALGGAETQEEATVRAQLRHARLTVERRQRAREQKLSQCPDRLKSQLNTAKQEIENLNGKVASLYGTISEMHRKVAHVENVSEKRRAQLADCEHKLTLCETQLASKQQATIKLEEENARLNRQIKASEADRDAAVQRLYVERKALQDNTSGLPSNEDNIDEPDRATPFNYFDDSTEFDFTATKRKIIYEYTEHTSADRSEFCKAPSADKRIASHVALLEHTCANLGHAARKLHIALDQYVAAEAAKAPTMEDTNHAHIAAEIFHLVRHFCQDICSIFKYFYFADVAAAAKIEMSCSFLAADEAVLRALEIAMADSRAAPSLAAPATFSAAVAASHRTRLMSLREYARDLQETSGALAALRIPGLTFFSRSHAWLGESIETERLYIGEGQSLAGAGLSDIVMAG